MKSIRDKIRYQFVRNLYSKQNDQLKYQIWGQLYIPLLNQLYNPLLNPLYLRIKNEKYKRTN
jgi:hypothetical protein